MRFDLHMHSRYSCDSLTTLREIAAQAKARRLDGIALTDHGTMAGIPKLKKIARETVGKGFLVICGEEIRTDLGDVLGLFIQTKVDAGDFFSVADGIHSQGGLVSIAHPSDGRRKSAVRLGRLSKKHLAKIDCIEAGNSRNTAESDARAKAFALEHHKGVTAGSDAHWPFEIGRTCIEAQAENGEELRKRLLSRDCRIHSKRTSVAVLGATKIVRLARAACRQVFRNGT